MPIKLVTINDLDSTQREVVEMQPYDSPMFVSGPPGSGKTSVAILRSRMLIDNGVTNVLFLLYNHSLYGFLKKIFTKMNIRQNVNIETKDSFFWGLSRRLGHPFPDGKSYEYKYAQILHNIDEVDEDCLPKYTLLVLDESQDFSRMELQLLTSRFMTERLTHPVFRIYPIANLRPFIVSEKKSRTLPSVFPLQAIIWNEKSLKLAILQPTK